MNTAWRKKKLYHLKHFCLRKKSFIDIARFVDEYGYYELSRWMFFKNKKVI